MRHFPRPAVASFLCLIQSLAGCGSSETPAPEATPSPDAGGAADTGRDAPLDSEAGNDAATIPMRPGEDCSPSDPSFTRVFFKTPAVAIATGQTRTVDVAVTPDLCVPVPLTFESTDATVVVAPKSETADLRHALFQVSLQGAKAGAAKIRAKVAAGGGFEAKAELDVTVMGSDLPACSGAAAGKVSAGGTVSGTGGLAGASIGLQAGADQPNSGPMYWHADPFDATIACAPDLSVSGTTALGPAVAFGPGSLKLQREIPITVPLNPARIPDKARMRHVRVAYAGPAFTKARVIPVADPRITQSGGVWSLSFLAPRLGTYQAVVLSDAGTKTFKRRLTHRAVIGVSMGAGGAASFGLRFHDRFDVIASLGGPNDWTYLLHYIETNHLAGFLPNDGDVVPSGLGPMPAPQDPYEHPQTFNKWWYEYPRDGNGGSFPREEYVQIFRDLALMYGNPAGRNDQPNGEQLPAGVDPGHQAVVGKHPGRECAVWVDPIKDDPTEAKQKELSNNCPKERCEKAQVLKSYFDDEYNPKGKWPVITVCDGSPQDKNKSPWANTWSTSGNDKPLEVGVAVDYNGNGIRDENEPVIRAGHEPYQDLGADGLASKDEPGYQAGVNEDPAGDDYNYQYNPTGKEGNGRWDPGEPFSDLGLDGVPNTASSPYDWGEGDKTYSMAPGLATFLDRDSRSIFHQISTKVPSGPLDDAALRRLDIWADGGLRDLFNFAVVGNHFVGGAAARGRAVSYYTGFPMLPGQNPNDNSQYEPGRMAWEDLPGVVMQRYGAIDPTSKDIVNGAGQHVGTADEIIRRLWTSLYFIGSRWPDAPRWFALDSQLDPVPGASQCEILGRCTFQFTDSRGRKGPVGINFPPGYFHKDQQDVRYPVIFMLHGYGQTPEDLEASLALLRNWMNSPSHSTATRLPKAILIYVDGRCRLGPTGVAECIRGTFFTESVRPTGAKIETWWSELIDHVDKTYRTMPASEVDWTE
jgi:hypothetical protein